MKLKKCNFSFHYEVKAISAKEIPAVLALCKGNPLYYQHMKSSPTLENLEAVIHELPPNKTEEDKYFVGYFKDSELVAILDLIVDYPNDAIAFIGWFMVDKLWQGMGIGSAIIEELQTELSKMQFKKLRLGYIKGNLQSANFWKKQGFLPSGEESETEDYTIVVAEKELG